MEKQKLKEKTTPQKAIPESSSTPEEPNDTSTKTEKTKKED